MAWSALSSLLDWKKIVSNCAYQLELSNAPAKLKYNFKQEFNVLVVTLF